MKWHLLLSLCACHILFSNFILILFGKNPSIASKTLLDNVFNFCVLVSKNKHFVVVMIWDAFLMNWIINTPTRTHLAQLSWLSQLNFLHELLVYCFIYMSGCLCCNSILIYPFTSGFWPLVWPLCKNCLILSFASLHSFWIPNGVYSCFCFNVIWVLVSIFDFYYEKIVA